jgi:SAM-dependent methyltransferase
VWMHGDFVQSYVRDRLLIPETMIFERYGKKLSGHVLELGCGGGRVTGHLVELAHALDAIDISPAMVAHCRLKYPQATFSEADLNDLSGFQTGSFDAVVASGCVVDVLDDTERRRLLDELARLLVPDGLMIASSHNLAFAPRIGRPTRIYARHPLRVLENLVRMPRRVRNRRQLRPLERLEPDYSILVDEAHDFTLLHYYISRDAQARQLVEHDFELLECFDLKGNLVGPGETSARSSELHYAARRIA